ncbi:hypothetical protein KJ903_00095 [Patescibacteria group bacterium]|nr:hypothetical protein [Patescibacteria group bacterium]
MSKKILLYILLGLVFVGLIFSYFYDIFHYDYAVPPGDDPIRHMTAAKYILDHQELRVYAASEAFDPPTFHILLATIANLTGGNIVSVTKYFVPFLCILAIFGIYFITKISFGSKRAAITALIFFGFYVPQLKQIYGDGTYLNIISALYLLVMTLIALIIYLNQKDKIFSPSLGLALIFAVAVFLSHSLSAIYLVFTLIIATVLVILLRKKELIKKILTFDIISAILFLPLTWNFYTKGTIMGILYALGIVQPTESVLAGLPAMFTTPATLNLNNYSKYTGIIVIMFFFLGLVLILKKYKHAPNLILLGWTLALFIGSRSSFFQLPHRYARDLAMPITIIAAYAIYHSFLYISSRHRRYLVISIFAVLLGTLIVGNLTAATGYNHMIRVQKSDEQAMAWIRNNTEADDVILGMPLTIVAGGWGSFINLLTDRTVLDGNACPEGDDGKCDPIYDPNSEISRQFYHDNSIDYVYAGKQMLGGHVSKHEMDWSYQKELTRADFLTKIAEFKEEEYPYLGNVKIFRVDERKLLENNPAN